MSRSDIWSIVLMDSGNYGVQGDADEL